MTLAMRLEPSGPSETRHSRQRLRVDFLPGEAALELAGRLIGRLDSVKIRNDALRETHLGLLRMRFPGLHLLLQPEHLAPASGRSAA